MSKRGFRSKYGGQDRGAVRARQGGKIPKAMRRFGWEYRQILDASGARIGEGIPADSDTRKPRAQQCGRETTGYIVMHTGLNRKRRRELSRGSVLPLRGTNRPVVGKLTLADIAPTAG